MWLHVHSGIPIDRFPPWSKGTRNTFAPVPVKAPSLDFDRRCAADFDALDFDALDFDATI